MIPQMKTLAQIGAKAHTVRNTPILLLACAVAIIAILLHIGVAFWAETTS